MISLYDVLKAEKTGLSDDLFNVMMAKKLSTVAESAKEYTGAVPTTITANGEPLISWTVYGNMQRTGTPTPTTPIQPSECGERTGNLFDKNATDTNNGYVANGYLLSDGTITTNNAYGISEYIPILSNQKYITYAAGLNAPSVCFYDTNKNYLSGVNYAGRQYAIFTTPSDAKYLRLSFRNVDRAIMFLNLGDTSLPYEPYGYKLDISSASTTTPVYLGKVESTRRIKKLVLTGEEGTDFYRKNTTSADNSLYYIRFSALQSVPLNGSPLYCTHLPNINYTPSDVVGITVGFTYNVIYFNLGLDVMNAQPSGNTVAGLKEYLAAQYAAGTPVTVWYVLATPETGVINEPLMKIGDYADSISNVTQIPTIQGSQTFDVDTTLEPSSVYLKYKEG